MSIPALSSALSGLNSNSTALGVTSNNIANAMTPGFSPQQATFQEASPAGSGVSLSVEGRSLAAAEGQGAVERGGASGLSGTDLATEVTNTLVYKAGFDLSARVVQATDARIGTLVNLSA